MTTAAPANPVATMYASIPVQEALADLTPFAPLPITERPAPAGPASSQTLQLKSRACAHLRNPVLKTRDVHMETYALKDSALLFALRMKGV